VIYVTHIQIIVSEGGLFTSETVIFAAQGAVVGGLGFPSAANAALIATGFTTSEKLLDLLQQEFNHQE